MKHLFTFEVTGSVMSLAGCCFMYRTNLRFAGKGQAKHLVTQAVCKKVLPYPVVDKDP